MSDQMVKPGEVVQRQVSRRDVLKAGAAGTAAVAGLHPKASKAFAAPAVLQGEPLTIKYVTWWWDEPGRQDAWRFLVEKFHSEQNEIRIEEAGWEFNDFTNNIVLQLQAGELEGEVISTTPDLVLRLLQAEVLEPLNPALERNNITTLSKAHDYITKDGNVYGLDAVTVQFGLFYNKAIFDAHGVTTLPTTPEEWLTLSTELTDRPNLFGMFNNHLIAEPDSFWFTLQQWANIYEGLWAQGTTPLLTSEPILNALQLFKDFYDATFPQGTNGPTATRMWGEGQIAQQMIVSAAVNVYKAEAPDLYPNIRSYSFPWPSKKTATRIHPLTVNATSPNKDAGVEFVTWVYKPENYRELLTRSLDVIPAYDVGGLEDYFSQLPWLDGYQDAVAITPPEMVGDFIFNNQEFGRIVITRFSEVLTGNRPVAEVMADAQREAEELATRLDQ